MKGHQFEEFEDSEINAIEVAVHDVIFLNHSGNSAETPCFNRIRITLNLMHDDASVPRAARTVLTVRQ